MPQVEYDRIKALLQRVLESEPTNQGRASGFVQRASKVTAVLFIQMLVLGCWQERETKLADLVQVGRRLGVQVSIPGLNQRLTGAAVALLQGVLRAALSHGHSAVAAGCAVFQRFTGVYLQDSTYVSLPPTLAEQLAGSGGKASAAGAKVVLNYEYRSGVIAALEVVAGRTPDQRCRQALQLAVAGSLHIFDLGFYALATLAQLAAAGSYFLCRHQYQTTLYTAPATPATPATPAGPERLDLLAVLKQHFRPPTAAPVWEFPALLGAHQHLPVRIVVARLPQAQVDARRRRIRANARRRNTTPAAATLALAEWNIFCTNVPTDWWSAEQVLTAYRIRWQVELLFKLFKSQAGLDHIGNCRPTRILCFFYAHLIALVLTQQLTAPLRFPNHRELSLPKAFHQLQHAVARLCQLVARRWRGLRPWLSTFAADCYALALKDKHATHPSTYQLLSDLNA